MAKSVRDCKFREEQCGGIYARTSLPSVTLDNVLSAINYSTSPDCRGRLAGDRVVGDVYVKRLHQRELKGLPVARFLNCVQLYSVRDYSRVTPIVPEPLGLVFRSEGVSPLGAFAVGGRLEGWYLSEFVEGKDLYRRLQSGVSEKDVRSVVVSLALSLKQLNEDGIFLLDFAPRDIVIPDFPQKYDRVSDPYFAPVFVDNEHLRRELTYSSDPSVPQFVDFSAEQIAQFREDFLLLSGSHSSEFYGSMCALFVKIIKQKEK